MLLLQMCKDMKKIIVVSSEFLGGTFCRFQFYEFQYPFNRSRLYLHVLPTNLMNSSLMRIFFIQKWYIPMFRREEILVQILKTAHRRSYCSDPVNATTSVLKKQGSYDQIVRDNFHLCVLITFLHIFLQMFRIQDPTLLDLEEDPWT